MGIYSGKKILILAGKPIGSKDIVEYAKYNGNWAEVILYSNESGQFKELYIDPVIEGNIHQIDLWVEKGELIQGFTGAHEAIGTLVLNFDSPYTLEKILKEYTRYIKVKTI